MKFKQIQKDIITKNKKQIILFETCSLETYWSSKIKTNYIGFQQLKFIYQKYILQTNYLLKAQKNNQNIFQPLIWIDLFIKRTPLIQQLEINTQNQIPYLFLKQQFKCVLESNQLKKLEKQKSGNQKEEKSRFQFSAQPVLSRILNERNEKEYRNIILCNSCLYLKESELQKSILTLMSLSLFLGQNIILNFLSLKTGQINKMVQIITQFHLAKNSRSSNQKSKIYIIHQSKQDINSLSHQFYFFKVRNISNLSIKSTLQKIKTHVILQFISPSSIIKKDSTVDEFFKKCDIASKVFQSYGSSKFKSDYIIFSQNQINLLTQKENKSAQVAIFQSIRQKFDKFYIILTNPNNSQLPLPNQILKFKVESFIKQQIKDKIKGDKLQKIILQYQKRIFLQNQKQIEKILKKSLVKFIDSKQNSSRTLQKILNTEDDPQRVEYKIKQFTQLLKETYIFLKQQDFQKYIYKQVYKSLYKKVYQKVQKADEENERKKDGKKAEIMNLKEEKEEIMSQLQILKGQNLRKSQLLKLEEKDKETLKKQISSLNQQLFDSKQNERLNQQKLSLQEAKIKELQCQLSITKKTLSLIQNTKNNSDTFKFQNNTQKLALKNQTLNPFNTQNSNILIGDILKQSSLSFNQLISSFQQKLNAYKQQCVLLHQQLKSNQLFLKEKQSYYQEKIHFLQENLKKYKEKQIFNNLNLKNLKEYSIKQVQLQHLNQIKLLQKQYQQSKLSYSKYIDEIQNINKQKNHQIQKLNDIIFLLKKQNINNEDNMKIIQEKILEKQRKTNQQQRIIQQNNYLLNQKVREINIMKEKLTQNILKVKILEDEVFKYQNLEGKDKKRSPQSSFIRFENPSESQKRKNHSFSKKSMIQFTPKGREQKILRANQEKVGKDQELQKLMQERRTIQKKKLRCEKRQLLLNKMESQIMFPKTQIKNLNSTIENFPQLRSNIISETKNILTQSYNKINQINSQEKKINDWNLQFKNCKKKLF